MCVKGDSNNPVFKRRWMVLKERKLTWFREQQSFEAEDNCTENFLLCDGLRIVEDTSTASTGSKETLAVTLAARQKQEMLPTTSTFVSPLRREDSTRPSETLFTFTVKGTGLRMTRFGQHHCYTPVSPVAHTR